MTPTRPSQVAAKRKAAAAKHMVAALMEIAEIVGNCRSTRIRRIAVEDPLFNLTAKIEDAP